MQNRKRVLITGGAGFVGSHLARRLLNDGCAVTVLDNLFTGSLHNIADLSGRPGFTFVEHDVVQPFRGQYDEIYNLACPASPIHYQFSPVGTLRTSVVGGMNMLELARETGARFFHTSTSEIYGDPAIHPQSERYWGNVNTIGVRSCYDEGKRCMETLSADYRRQYGVDVRMIRIFNTYGPNMDARDGRVVSNFIVQALKNEDITIYGDGSQTRSFQYCDDLVAAIVAFMAKPQDEVERFFAEKGLGAPVLNIGNPDEYTMKQLAEEVLRQLPQSTSRIVYRPLPVDDPKRRRPDNSLAREFLNWEPRVPLAEGLAKTISYFRANLG